MQRVSGHWYSLINYFSGGISVILLLAFGLNLFGIEPALISSLGIVTPVAVIALVQIIFSLIIYPLFAKEEKEYFYSLISIALFTVELAILVQSSGGLLSLGLIVLFLTAISFGAFGQTTIVFGAVSFAGFFIASRPELLRDISEFNIHDLVYICFGALSLLLSYLVWRRHYVHFGNQTPVPEKVSKKISPSRLIESIRDGVVVIDSKGYIVEFNPASANLVGWSVNDAKGLDFRSVFTFVDETGHETKQVDPITQTLRDNNPISNQQMVIKNRVGELVELSVSIAPFETDTGINAIAVMRDVSEQNKQQRQKEEFISTASHEMRTPVAAIEGYISLAMNSKVSAIDDKARNYLTRAHEATAHLGELFRDLLTASRSEDGRLENHPEPVEMGSFLDKLTNDVRFTAESKGLELKYLSSSRPNETITPLFYAMVDRERMREVITNLIDNAAKFTKEGSISVSLTGDEEHLKITISDTGIGMPEEDINHLFQKFYRIDNTATRQIGGTGLGLFICKQIVELYHGRIWAESELGKGSSFIIELPRFDQNKADQIVDKPVVIQPGSQTSTIAELSSTAKPPEVAPAVEPEASTSATTPLANVGEVAETPASDPPQAQSSEKL